jgi:hypothetical protein
MPFNVGNSHECLLLQAYHQPITDVRLKQNEISQSYFLGHFSSTPFLSDLFDGLTIMEMSGLPASNDIAGFMRLYHAPYIDWIYTQVELEPSAYTSVQCGDVIMVDTCSLYLETGICFCTLKP